MTSRAHLPSRLEDLLRAPANVAVHGTPGSGKSWIADRLIDLLSHAVEDIEVVRLDLSTVGSGSEVFASLREAVSGDVFRPFVEVPVRDAWRDARAVIAAFDRPIVLVLDQFDRALHFADAQEFLLLLREMLHRPEATQCTALLLSRRSLQSIESSVRGISTLASLCYTEYMGAVRMEDLGSLGAAGGGITEGEAMACLAWSGGHPALAKYWLATRPDRFSDISAELERAKVAVRVLDHLTSIDLLDAAAQLVLGPVLTEFFLERQELELLGVLRATESQELSVLADLEIFRNALRSRTWNMNPWGMLGHAEVRLRSIVDSLLTEAYGVSWVNVVAERSKAVAVAAELAAEKGKRDALAFGREASWLSYTYPADLWTIIQSEWDVFRAVFDSHDKRYWREVMTGLARYRAPLAHGRPEVLSEEQKVQCRLFADEVVRSIHAYESSRGV